MEAAAWIWRNPWSLSRCCVYCVMQDMTARGGTMTTAPGYLCLQSYVMVVYSSGISLWYAIVPCVFNHIPAISNRCGSVYLMRARHLSLSVGSPRPTVRHAGRGFQIIGCVQQMNTAIHHVSQGVRRMYTLPNSKQHCSTVFIYLFIYWIYLYWVGQLQKAVFYPGAQ